MEPKRLRAALRLSVLAAVTFGALWVAAPRVLDRPSADERAAEDACETSARQAMGSEATGIDAEATAHVGATWTVHVSASDRDWTCEARRGPNGRWFARFG